MRLKTASSAPRENPEPVPLTGRSKVRERSDLPHRWPLVAGICVVVLSVASVACDARKEASSTREREAVASKSLPVPSPQPLALSIHIGVKRLSPAHYGRLDSLEAPAVDAREMQRLARKAGFVSSDEALIVNENATAERVTRQIDEATKRLIAGDTLLLTFSGHGTLLPDGNGDETSRYDSVWCLYDRALVDDEVSQLLSRLKPGVHALVVSDSCHSGTVVTFAPPDYRVMARGRSRNGVVFVSNVQRVARRPKLLRGVKQLTFDEASDVYSRNKALYNSIQQSVPGQNRLPIRASVALLSACQDER